MANAPKLTIGGQQFDVKDAQARADVAELKSAFEIKNGIVFPAINGGKDIEISAGTEIGYYSNSSLVYNANFRCIEFIVPINANKLSYTYLLPSSTQAGAILDANRGVLQTLSGDSGNHEYNIPANACYIDLNFFNGTFVEKYVLTVEPLAKKSDISSLSEDVKEVELFLNGTTEDITFTQTGTGYFQTSGALSYTAGGTGDNQVMVINNLTQYGISVGDTIKIKVGYAANTKGALGFSENTISATTSMASVIEWNNTTDTVQELTAIIPQGTAAIAIYNRKPNKATPEINVLIPGEMTEIEGAINALETNVSKLTEVKYGNCVEKPMSFSGKSCIFFGDSITYGYIAASGGTPAHQATNQYPKLFAEGVGATYTNAGVSGSTLSPVQGLTCIYTTIQNATLDSDYIFIAGGVNDWNNGVSKSELETAVENICDYLDSNYNGNVIFITPIATANRTPGETALQTLQSVRNVITRIALEHGYSVVQGNEFPFPVDGDDSDYISAMFQDGLHPTELGYSMYAQALRNAVC